MILFTSLLITLLLCAVAAAILLTVGGVGFIAVFGDAIVCGTLIVLLAKLFRRKKKGS